jgi:hypothetical protein
LRLPLLRKAWLAATASVILHKQPSRNYYDAHDQSCSRNPKSAQKQQHTPEVRVLLEARGTPDHMGDREIVHSQTRIPVSHGAQTSRIWAACPTGVRKCGLGALPAESDDVFQLFAGNAGTVRIHALHSIHSLRCDFDRDL